jgi:serine/threonine protein kinase/tetratricopeptide (TPR) repeat protein
MAARAADRNLLFGLLALQNGLINQVQLVAAFQAWILDKVRTLADHLIALGHLNDAQRAVVEAMADLHVAKHGDVEQSLAAIPAGRSTRESLAQLGDPDIEGTLVHVGTGSTQQDGEADPDRTAAYSVGTATSEGQRFRVLRPHARGGLGAVFVALDTELHREVALKQILDKHADDRTSRQRFLLEAEVTGGLEHPGIVPVYGLGTYGDGRPYYAMRFIKGDSLKAAIGRCRAETAWKSDPGRRSLELRKLLRRLTDVCNAIEYAHSRGVLHRDLKPGNVIVGRHGETLVVDWGLAKTTGQSDPSSGERTLLPSSASGSAETLPGSALGTPGYMSPEQAEGDLEHLGPRSDVYSLGATLYCLLTGRPPFAGEAVDVIPAVRRGDFRSPRQVDSSIDRALEAVCLKAMALKPEDRYGSCRALAEDIERWMADEPVSACREPFSRRARRWVRRHQRLVTGVTAAALVAAVALVTITTLISISNRQLAVANRTILENSRQIARQYQELERANTRLEQTRSEAVKERDQAREVTDFLVLSFRKPDPAQDGRKVTVAEVLGSAVKVLEERKITPATKATIFSAIGESYYDLGLTPEAVSINEKALGIRRQELGEYHNDTLEAMNILAMSCQQAGQFGRAISLHEQVLEARRVRLGEDHPATLQSMNNLALAYRDAGQLERSIPLLERALEGKRVKLGDDHPDTLLSMDNLASSYKQAGQLDRALSLHQQAFKAWRVKLGDDHPDTLLAMGNLAVAYQTAGQLDRAIPLLEQVLAAHRVKLGENHPHTLVSMSHLAGAYGDAGQLDRAIPLLEQALTAHRSKFGDEYFGTLFVQASLASCYMKSQRYHDSELLLREVVTAAGRSKPRHDRFYSDTLGLLGGCLMHERKFDEAVPILRESLTIKEQTQPDGWTPAYARSLLGEALAGQKAFAEAEPLVLSGYEHLKARESQLAVPEQFRLREAAERVVRLYENWGKTVQAAAWKAKLGLLDLPVEVFARP